MKELVKIYVRVGGFDRRRGRSNMVRKVIGQL